MRTTLRTAWFALLLCLGSGALAAPDWGPEIGTVAPPIAAPDQDGRTRGLDDLGRENGLLFLFNRSADW